MSKRAPKKPHFYDGEGYHCACIECLDWAGERVTARSNNPPALAWCIVEGACDPAIDWIVENKIRTMNQAWWLCERTDWLGFMIGFGMSLRYLPLLRGKSVTEIRKLVHPEGCPNPPRSVRRRK